MCYQKFHTCRYCELSYPCNEDNYTCATLNHDVDMEMCLACKKLLEDKLKLVNIDEIDLMNIRFEDLLNEDDQD